MSNEAAERLMIHLGSWEATKLREALAAERKATVERIRAAIRKRMDEKRTASAFYALDEALLILDAEAAR